MSREFEDAVVRLVGRAGRALVRAVFEVAAQGKGDYQAASIRAGASRIILEEGIDYDSVDRLARGLPDAP